MSDSRRRCCCLLLLLIGASMMPILFYLKCLDQDNPSGADKEELKNLISREILARKKFILCKSKFTTPPLCSEWIEWEIQEVIEMKRKNRDVQIYEIDIEEQNVKEKVRSIVRKQSKVLVACAIEVGNQGIALESFLNARGLEVECFIESGDMRDEVTKWFGCHAKDIAHELVSRYEDKGIIVALDAARTPLPIRKWMTYTIGLLNLSVRDEICAVAY